VALPSDLTSITVTGTYASITGAPLAGQVNFSLTTPVEDATGKVIFNAFTQSVTLSPAGTVSIVLPCTDNADLNPTNFTYLVTEVIPGLGRAYYVQLPHTLGSTVDLSALAPVSAPPAATAFASANTWTATQTFSGNPGFKVTTGAVSGDVLTSDASGNATWQPSNPMTTLGDLIYENATPAAARLAGNTASTKNFLTQTGTGAVSAAPAWGTIAAGDVPTLNQNTTGTAANLTGGATLPAYLAPKVVTLTFVGSGTTLVDASLGNAFNLTLTASTTTLGNPSNSVDGEVIRFRITQGSGGSFTLAYGANYDFGTAGTPTLTTTAAKVDILGFEYVASISKWCYLGSGLGF
jgi:hypothetical protein